MTLRQWVQFRKLIYNRLIPLRAASITAPTLICVGFPPTGLKGNGKVRPGYFFPPFAEALAGHGVQLLLIRNHRVFLARDPLSGRSTKCVVLPIYNETCIHQDNALREAVGDVEKTALARYGERSIIHGLHFGATIGDKTAANRLLRSAGVPMPELLNGATAPSRIFSNANVGTQEPVAVIEPGQATDLNRYNTAYIDTVHSFRGKSFHVCLRAMCVGAVCVSLLVRARPVEDGSVSVHSRNTPVDSALLNHFYQTIAIPRRRGIEDICATIAAHLGIGFYAHDLLPEAGSDRVFVCETGFKMNDRTLHTHLLPLRADLAFGDSLFGAEIARTADAFVAEARRAGMLS